MYLCVYVGPPFEAGLSGVRWGACGCGWVQYQPPSSRCHGIFMVPMQCSVEVAVRVRPMAPAERLEACECAVVALDEASVMVGADKAFTFNYAFAEGSGQGDVFDACVHPLVVKCMEGYNATVFAYGQTVSVWMCVAAGWQSSHCLGGRDPCQGGLPTPRVASCNPVISAGLWQDTHHGGQCRSGGQRLGQS